MNQSRIIFVPGILTSAELQKLQWARAAAEMFPVRDIVVIEKTYLYTQHEVIVSLREQVMNLVRDGVPTTLVGHSFGGVVATAVAHQAQREGLNNIIKLVTMATPHSLQMPEMAGKLPEKALSIIDIARARQAVGYMSEDLDIPVYTFGARIDHVVPRVYTQYPGSIHMNILSTHSGFWLAPRSWRYRHVWNALRD